MRDAVLSAYRRLPAPARTLAASLRGVYLRRWRYGADTEELVAAALERDSWTAPRWKSWQEERLAPLLHRAATRVPHYREHWERRRRDGDRSSWEVLGNWPLLTKEELRKNPGGFLDDTSQRRTLFEDRTSGTTGTPLSIFASRSTLHAWYALVEARLRRWNGVTIRKRWALLGGQLVVPVRRRRPPYWVRNYGLNQLYLSSQHLSSDTAADFARALRQFGPEHLLVYPASAALLAQWVLEQGLRLPPMRVVLSNADTLLEGQRRIIAEAFGCPMRDSYGMCEMVAGASECVEGRMHWWPEAGHVEVLGEGLSPAQGGESGRLVATGLLNTDMPLIRYEVGDRARVSPPDAACACGRGLPVLEALEGRVSDLVVTADGRRVFWLNPAFYGLEVREAQIVQERIDRLRVKLVCGMDSWPATAETVAARLRDRVGEGMEIIVDRVEEIPRTAGGKLRPIIGLGSAAP